jgi:hypothetical protein
LKNPAASARARLLNYSQRHGLVFNNLLTRYALEGFLARLAAREFADQFILKGGMLYHLWETEALVSRTTRDLDLLGQGEVNPQRILALFKALDSPLATAEDGLLFHPDKMFAEIIRGDHHGGIRFDAQAQLDAANIRFHVDIGFGDVVYPAAQVQAYPRLLEFIRPMLRVYPKETVIAEKFEAMVVLGLANSRMKDFYDLGFLSSRFQFKGTTLSKALQGTFAHRKTPFPVEKPVALTKIFAEDPTKQAQWKAFLRKNRFPEKSLAKVIRDLDDFLSPIVAGDLEAMKWNPGGPWLM